MKKTKKTIQELGGEATKKKYGTAHYRKMNEIRWSKDKKRLSKNKNKN